MPPGLMPPGWLPTGPSSRPWGPSSGGRRIATAQRRRSSRRFGSEDSPPSGAGSSRSRTRGRVNGPGRIRRLPRVRAGARRASRRIRPPGIAGEEPAGLLALFRSRASLVEVSLDCARRRFDACEALFLEVLGSADRLWDTPVPGPLRITALAVGGERIGTRRPGPPRRGRKNRRPAGRGGTPQSGLAR